MEPHPPGRDALILDMESSMGRDGEATSAGFVREFTRAEGLAEAAAVLARHVPAIVGVDGTQVAVRLRTPTGDTIVGAELLPPLRASLALTDNETPVGTITLHHGDPAALTVDDIDRVRDFAGIVARLLRIHRVLPVFADTDTTIDRLTGLLSRSAILDFVDVTTATHESPALLSIDIDSFRSVNELHGHEMGDRVLRVLGARIAPLLSDDEHIGRLGGDEFLVVVPEDPHGVRADEIADLVLDVVRAPIADHDLRLTPTVSIGVACSDDRSTSATELLADVEHALRAAKRTDAAVVHADRALRARAAMISMVDRELDHAMIDGRLTFHYQAICDLDDEETLGAEALVRWHDDEHGAIPAPLIIDRVLATGRTERFTLWSLDRVAADLATMRAHVPAFADKAISINVDHHQLSIPDFPRHHTAALRRHGLRDEDIIIEVVESSAIEPNSPAERCLRELGETGTVIALDDYGVGQSALTYFTRFPVNAVKIDRSLVQPAATDATSFRILRSVVRMCADLGILALAEGVEDSAELHACLSAGIQMGQGWHYGRPESLDAFVDARRNEFGARRSPVDPL